jgi:hypothetical protein
VSVPFQNANDTFATSPVADVPVPETTGVAVFNFASATGNEITAVGAVVSTVNEIAGDDVAEFDTSSPWVTVAVNVAFPSDFKPVAAAQFSSDTVNDPAERVAVIVDTKSDDEL